MVGRTEQDSGECQRGSFVDGMRNGRVSKQEWRTNLDVSNPSKRERMALQFWRHLNDLATLLVI